MASFGECNIRHLLFADDLALLSSSKSDLQYAHDQFSDACLNAGMKISMAKLDYAFVKTPCPMFFLNNWSNSPADREV